MRHTLLSLMVAAALSWASTASAEIYTWVDDHGQTHYTDSYYDVPARYRDQIEDIGGELEQQGRLSVIEGLNGSEEEGGPGQPAGAPQGLMAQMEKALAEAQAAQPGGGAPKLDMSALAGVGAVMLIVMLLVIVPITVGIGALVLKMACSLAGEEPIGLGKAMLVVFMQAIAGGMASGTAQMVALIDPTSPGMLFGGLALSLIATVLAYAAVLRGMHCESFGAAIKVTMVTFVVGLVLSIGVGVVFGLGAAILT